MFYACDLAALPRYIEDRFADLLNCIYTQHVGAAHFGVIYDLVCLTGHSQSASEHSGQSQQQEDRGDALSKEDDKCDFMDFPVREVAEQLTRLDAVSLALLKGSFPSHCCSLIADVCPPGAVCQSGALPVSGLRLVPARQEGKPKPGAHRAGHHLSVQRRHQPGHHLPPLLALSQPFHFLSHLITQLLLHLPLLLHYPKFASLRSHHAGSESTYHREVDRCRSGQGLQLFTMT